MSVSIKSEDQIDELPKLASHKLSVILMTLDAGCDSMAPRDFMIVETALTMNGKMKYIAFKVPERSAFIASLVNTTFTVERDKSLEI